MNYLILIILLNYLLKYITKFSLKYIIFSELAMPLTLGNAPSLNRDTLLYILPYNNF